MIIYRVEHVEHKTGPFRLDDNDSTIEFINKFDLKTHACPNEDGIHGFDGLFDRIGCRSLEQLKYWFASHVEYLKNIQMVIRVFECDDENVKIGRTQVAFCYNAATVKHELSLDCLN